MKTHYRHRWQYLEDERVFGVEVPIVLGRTERRSKGQRARRRTAQELVPGKKDFHILILGSTIRLKFPSQRHKDHHALPPQRQQVATTDSSHPKPSCPCRTAQNTVI
eukprot:scaffold2482_cov196-Alexandrium_tamarense.AAC.29